MIKMNKFAKGTLIIALSVCVGIGLAYGFPLLPVELSRGLILGGAISIVPLMWLGLRGKLK